MNGGLVSTSLTGAKLGPHIPLIHVAVDPDVWTFSAKGIMTQWAENDRTNGFNGYNGGFNTIKLELYIGFNTLMVFYG
jgi:hypothetical protein